MSFSEAIKDGFDHYAKFDGRASRPSFWWWVLFVIIVSIVANIIDSAIDAPVLSTIVGAGLLLPGLSKAIRRLHDTGRTGWWILIGLIPLIGFIVLLIFYLEKSEPTENQYGPPPADAAPAVA